MTVQIFIQYRELLAWYYYATQNTVLSKVSTRSTVFPPFKKAFLWGEIGRMAYIRVLNLLILHRWYRWHFTDTSPPWRAFNWNFSSGDKDGVIKDY